MLPFSTQSKCVVLVPVGGHIEPACEAALRELERRGYPVWRVRGFAAIDQARNQMATDALNQGYDETLWIDSDVGFNPNDVELLRRHRLPIVCAIYPKKGMRALAAHVLPGTPSLTFGKGGGLVEIRFAATGFLLVHREVYTRMERELKLPTCNLQFKQPMVPYFQPMVIDDPGGPWYLAEDYAFCERARRCRFPILADTRVRLFHFGSYGYSWEEAGNDVWRYDTYTHFITDSLPAQLPSPVASAEPPPVPAAPSAAPASPSATVLEQQKAAIAQLRAAAPWPQTRPTVQPRMQDGWLREPVQRALAAHLSQETQLVVELGSWLGLSTRFISDCAPNATVIAVDHWLGSEEHHTRPEYKALLPELFETFLVNCWSYQERILPLRMDGGDGLRLLAQHGLLPDLIYVDADHSYAAVRRDFELILDLFPHAVVVGDDWDWPGVSAAVTDVADARKLQVDTDGLAWRYIPPTRLR